MRAKFDADVIIATLEHGGGTLSGTMKVAIIAACNDARAEGRREGIEEAARLFPCSAQGAESFHRTECHYHKIRGLLLPSRDE